MSPNVRKEIDALLASLRRQGWRVERGKGYYKCFCGPPHQRCFKTVKLSPSDPNYVKNLRGWLRRSGCWEEEP